MTTILRLPNNERVAYSDLYYLLFIGHCRMENNGFSASPSIELIDDPDGGTYDSRSQEETRKRS